MKPSSMTVTARCSSVNKRAFLSTCAAFGLSASIGSQPAWARRPDRFETLMAATRGAVAAQYRDFVVQSPEGNTCSARLAFPAVVNNRMPVLLFCPDEGARTNQYDAVMGALASQGFFVMGVDRRVSSVARPSARASGSSGQISDERLRVFAETRFLLDAINAATAALGANASQVDTTRVGAMGHGAGAWIAAGLGGWDENGAPSTRTRDGRIYSVFGLTPSANAAMSTPPAQRSPDGVVGMFAGDLRQMPTPARNSGLLGLGLPIQSNTFGGLIGTQTGGQSRRGPAEPEALSAAIASAALFFDWTLRGSQTSQRDLMGLDGRNVQGLREPLTLRRA